MPGSLKHSACVFPDTALGTAYTAQVNPLAGLGDTKVTPLPHVFSMPTIHWKVGCSLLWHGWIVVCSYNVQPILDLPPKWSLRPLPGSLQIGTLQELETRATSFRFLRLTPNPPSSFPGVNAKEGKSCLDCPPFVLSKARSTWGFLSGRKDGQHQILFSKTLSALGMRRHRFWIFAIL